MSNLFSGLRKNWFQILATCTGSLVAFTTGLFFSWPSPSIPNLIDETGEYRFTLEECSYLAVISSLTMALSSFFPGFFMDKIGRKHTLIFNSIFYITAGLINITAENIYAFYLARVFTGTGDAFLFAVLPVYTGEITTPQVRGTWGNMLSIMMFTGQFAINVIGGYLTIRTTSAICLAFPVLFFVSFIFMPETPYFCLMEGRIEDARRSLQRLRRTEDVGEELESIEAAVKRQIAESSNWKDLFSDRTNRIPTITVIFMRICQQTAGYATFAVYAKYIFQKASGNISATVSAIIYTGAVCGFTLIGSAVMDRMGRRVAMVSTLVAASIILALLSVYFYLDAFVDAVDLVNVKFIPLLGMLLYVVAWSFGYGIVPNLMLGELFSASVKGKGLCVANIAFGLSICAMSKLFQVLETNFGLYFPFAFFAVCTAANSVLMYFIVPETKGKTLEEIQQSFKAKSKSKLEFSK